MANSYQRFQRMYTEHVRNKPEMSFEPVLTVTSPPPVCMGATKKRLLRRWENLGVSPEIRNSLLPEETLVGEPPGLHLIENYIGQITIPVGLAGPLRINGIHATGDFYVPMATIEPTLVAAYSRGAYAITKSGGCAAIVLDEGVVRAAGFEFNTLAESVCFANWASENYAAIKDVAEATTKFGKLIDMKPQITGRYVHLIFDYSTGDAIGQNMATIATDAILKYVQEKSPVLPRFYTVEGNMSGDKKASVQAFQSVRGRKVSTDVIIPADVCKTVLNTTPELIKKYNDMAYVGGLQLGSIGTPGQYPNGITAFYLACGQDTACTAESSVGITFLDVTDNGDLYASVTLPNVMVGSIGNVSQLASQKACLDIMDCFGDGKAPKLAEICTALTLAGEISIIAALSVDEFTSSHMKLGRKKHPRK